MAYLICKLFYSLSAFSETVDSRKNDYLSKVYDLKQQQNIKKYINIMHLHMQHKRQLTQLNTNLHTNISFWPTGIFAIPKLHYKRVHSVDKFNKLHCNNYIFCYSFLFTSKSLWCNIVLFIMNYQWKINDTKK